MHAADDADLSDISLIISSLMNVYNNAVKLKER
jgi:ABC-type amino acid transport system permease subunit